jgi:hypothetical protein
MCSTVPALTLCTARTLTCTTVQALTLCTDRTLKCTTVQALKLCTGRTLKCTTVQALKLCTDRSLKCTTVQALKLCTGRTAHRLFRRITQPLHDHCTRSWRGFSFIPRPLFTPGKTRYPFYRRLGGSQDRCGKSRPPPGFDPRTVQPVASCYTDYAARPTLMGNHL